MLHTFASSSVPDMSSDPFAELASSTEAFAREFRAFMNRNPRPAPGSPATKEALGEPFAGDWSDHPSSDIFATTYLASASCTDHLLGLADALNALFAAYTLTRGAVEATALGCYLTDHAIDARERVRRTMNYRLDAMCERVWLFSDMPGDYAAEKLYETRQRIASFARAEAWARSTVPLPLATTTPVPEPARTTVHISAQQRNSAGGVPAATGSLDFSAGIDSPVSTDSSHSSPAVASSRSRPGPPDQAAGSPHRPAPAQSHAPCAGARPAAPGSGGGRPNAAPRPSLPPCTHWQIPGPPKPPR